jgi:hypothetical protein
MPVEAEIYAILLRNVSSALVVQILLQNIPSRNTLIGICLVELFLTPSSHSSCLKNKRLIEANF